MSLIEHDRRFLESVPALIGIDEAGRGPLAGPVCAAAVYVDRAFFESAWFFEYASQVNDSKQLKEGTRERLFEAIENTPPGLIHSACRMSTVEDIETLNILGATRKAMAGCVDELKSKRACRFNRAFEGDDSLFSNADDSSVAQLLVDGRPLKPFPYLHTAIVKGDGKSLAIALASIVAKVTRDRYMRKQAEVYPDYGFTSNKGYGTPRHVAALRECGPCELHRMSFLNQILS